MGIEIKNGDLMAFPPLRGESLADGNTPGVEGFSTTADGTRGDTSSSAKNGLVGTNSATASAPTSGPPAGNGVFGFSEVPNASGVIGIGVGSGVMGFSAQGDGTRGDTHSTAKNGIVGTNDGSVKAAPGGAPSGNGVFGFSAVQPASGDIGVRASGVFGAHANTGIGVTGTSNQGQGVFGKGSTGVEGEGSSTGVFAGGQQFGVQAVGAIGIQTAGTPSGVGIFAHHQGAAQGEQQVGIGDVLKAGKFGVVAYGDSAGVNAFSLHGDAVSAFSQDGVAVAGRTTGSPNAIAVHGIAPKDTGALAGKFDGDVDVEGKIFKKGGGFKIDHPLAPKEKYLHHSFVESPERKNVYDGIAVLDETGRAVVELPAWFEALNSDFRYQLTCIGRFAPVYVSAKLAGNRFTISGGSAGVEVSWQVTGVRIDSWARANPFFVEENKQAVSTAACRQAAWETESSPVGT